MRISKIEVVGFASTWIILIGYLFMKIGQIEASGLIYQVINLIGAAGIIWVSLKRKAKQPAILNVIWIVVAIIAIGRLFL